MGQWINGQGGPRYIPFPFWILRFFDSPIPSLLFLISCSIPVLFLGLSAPAFMDHEGRYAEVAREMLLTGDWITPQLNFTPFLNKPPLAFWITALIFRAIRISESARAWVAVSGVGTLLVTFLLGHILAGPHTAFYSSLILLLSGGFFLETRLLRPDMLLTLCVTVAFYGFLKAEHSKAEPERTRWLCLSAISLAFSVMTKGFVGVIIVAATIGIVLLWCGRLVSLRDVRWTYPLAVALCVIVPWHFLVGLRHPGFFWDYAINQHLLFFFDQKFPRDSIPDSVTVFWGAFLGRTVPWSIFLPVAMWHTVREARHSPSLAMLLPLTWLSVVLLLFSLSPSRLEHYSIPALPAVALLVGRWWANIPATASAGTHSGGVGCVLLALAGICGFFLTSPLLATEHWTQQFPLLQQYALSVCRIIIVSSLLAAMAFWGRRPQLAFAVLACMMPWQFLHIYHSLVLIEPLNSWKPIGECIARLPSDGEILFAASEEYQICGGLNFYSQRPLTIILPDGFTPPTYLDVQNSRAFISTEEAVHRWRESRPVLLLVDPARKEDRSLTTRLSPTATIGQWGDRLLLANRNFAERTPATYDCSTQLLFNRQR